MKKNDKRLISILLGIAVIGLLLYFFWPKTKGAEAVVWIDGKEYGRYLLNQNTVVALPGAIGDNEMTIENGEVWMSKAVCPDKYCMRQGKIQNQGHSITCLPGKIVITIEGNPDSTVDFIGQ